MNKTEVIRPVMGRLKCSQFTHNLSGESFLSQYLAVSTVLEKSASPSR